jgi:hypothetical protein
MADLPQPRSYQSILSDIIDAFLSRFGLKRLKIGGPILSIMEAAAQSDVRSSQDIFNLLDAQSLDRATGVALDNAAADENLSRIPVTAATGLVNFLDTSFTKISSTVYQGAGAPNIGTISLKVADATSFPASGQIYIGRGTINYEGPLTYTAKVKNPGDSFWTLTLAPGTTKFHNLGESVIVAKGGIRVIPAGTGVQTPQGNVSDAVKFSTLYKTQIEDGETTIENIEVVAEKPGVIGNVPSGTIREVIGSPYTGASVTNVLPFTNGLPAEGDQELRERVKDAKQSRSKGTNLAIASGVKGVTSKEDNKTVISASIVSRQGDGSTLYIDDGTGYEETVAGVASETLMDSALGGEQLFQLSSQRPIAKAFLETNSTAPFILSSGDKLAVKVGGVLTEHSFSLVQFKSITNATAYEIVASINGNPLLGFSARTSANGTKVVIFGKTEENEEIEVVTPLIGNNANDALGFASGTNYTLRLYKNDSFLYKDGKDAIFQSNPQNLWSLSITNGDTLQIKVDGTSTQSVTFNNTDFVSNNTGYTTVSSTNSLESWATVFNAKVTGVSTVGTAGILELTSNLNKSSRGKIEIVGGTLIGKGMFNTGIATGSNADYTLDRNTGQLKLTTGLIEGDTLSAATEFTRAYLQSDTFASSTVTLAADANLWFSIDGSASVLATALTSGTSLTITSLATNRARYTGPSNTFGTTSGAYIKAGDWVIIWDPAFTDKGMWRVSAVSNVNYEWFEVERATVTAETKIPSSSGIVFVRSNSALQKVTVTSGVGLSLAYVASTIGASLIGGVSSVFRNTNLRVGTSTYGNNGDILLATADIEGQKLKLPRATLKTNSPSHFATIESASAENGSPGFAWTTIATVPSATTFTLTNPPSSLPLRSGDLVSYRKRLNVSNDRWGADAGNADLIQDITSGTIAARVNSKTAERLVNDRVFASSAFGMAADDNLSLILDQDKATKNFNISMFRNVKPLAGATYGSAAFQIRDLDSSDLYAAFGTNSLFFNDFAVYMRARGKSHSTTVNKTILFRNSRYGSDGNYVRFAYANPSAPSQPFSLTTNTNNGYANVLLKLPSSTERTGLNINGNNYFAFTNNQRYGTGSNPIISIVNAANIVTVTLEPAGTTNAHTLVVGDMIFDSLGEAGFPKGPKAVTAVTANSFSYAEVGAGAGTGSNHLFITSKRPAGTTNTMTALSVAGGTTVTATIGAHVFAVGDTVYFQPGHTDLSGTIDIAAGAKVLTAVGATTVTWTDVATGSGAATLIAGVNYTISSGECVKATATFYKAEVNVGFLGRSGSTVQAVINQTDIVSQHPYNVGDIVYLSPGEADFPAGPKIITGVGTNFFNYTEAGAAVASTAVQYFSSTNLDVNFTGGGTPVIAGDIVHIDAATSFDSIFKGDFRVFSVSSTKFSFLIEDNNTILSGLPKKINGTTNLRFYPISSTTASAVVSWINANSGGLLSAILVSDNSGAANNGTGVIDTATAEEFYLTTTNASLNGSGSRSLDAFPLYDGLNWVRASSLVNAGNTTISLKDPVSGELSARADFDNEILKLVPITVTNLKNYLGSTAVSGFASNSTVSSSSDGRKLQLSSSAIGSAGAIQTSGGTANSTSAAVYGTGAEISILGAPVYSKVTVLSSQTKGLAGGMTVSVEGTNTASKVTSFGTGTTMSVTATTDANEWLITFGGTGSSIVANSVYSTGTARTFQVEKHGNFMAYIETNPTGLVTPIVLSAVKEGHIVYINSTGFSSINTGRFQVVRVDDASHTFWIENPNGVEEIVSTNTASVFQFTSYDSASVGDQLIINTSVLGTSNLGTFTISRLNGSSSTSFYVNGAMTAKTATSLSSEYVFVQIKEGSPIRLIKKIRTISRNPSDVLYSDIVFTTSQYATKMSAFAGSLIVPLDKLGFNTNINQGLNGYSYNTGLLSEVNRVVYGDEANSAVYPGIQANGTNINISGPLIKRITVSLAIRLRTGVSSVDIIERVKSSIASVINSTAVGTNIAISDLVSAANNIDGVLAVTILSPEYDAGKDLIAVQASEKPKVLDIAQDILVSIVN